MAETGLVFKLFTDLTNFQSGINKAGAQISGFQSQINKLGGIMTGVFSVTAISAFAIKSATAYDAQAKAERGLLTALKGRSAVQRDLLKQAADLQGTTLFGDEQTVEAQKQLAVMGLTGEQIKKLIPGIQDYATVMKLDLATAAQMVAKTVGSSTNALRRQGIEIDMSGTKSEKAARLVEALNDKFGGQAEDAAKVGTGAYKQLGNAIGDLVETFGKALTSNTSFVNQLTDGLLATNEVLNSDVVPSWKKWLMLVDPTMRIAISAATDVAKRTMEQQLIDSKASLAELRKNAKQTIAEILAAEATKRAENAEEAKKQQNEALANYKKQADKIREINELTELGNDIMRQRLQLMLSQNETFTPTFADKMSQSKGRFNDMLTGNTDEANVSDPFNTAAVAASTVPPMRFMDYEGELARLKQALDDGSMLYQDYANAVSQLEMAKNEAIYSGLESMFGNMASLFNENTAAYKAFASAQAIMATYKNANEAFGAMAGIPIVGPALGAIAAGAAIAAGLANVAKINSVGMAYGGIVPPGYPNDSYPAMLTSGETVVPANKLPDFKRLGSSEINLNMDSIIRGQDLKVVLSRADYKHQRAFGY